MSAAISREVLAHSIASGSLLVIEALGEDFYRSGHLPNAVNVPLSSPDRLLRDTVTGADLPVVVYGSCNGGIAQELAQRIEQLCGCSVYVFAGGKEEWVEAGLPIVHSVGGATPGSAGAQD